MDVLACDLRRMSFANRGLRGIHMTRVSAPSMRLEAGDVQRRQEYLSWDKHFIFPSPKNVREHGPTVVINRGPSPSRLRFLVHRAPHRLEG
jgi:hypothetical protein